MIAVSGMPGSSASLAVTRIADDRQTGGDPKTAIHAHPVRPS